MYFTITASWILRDIMQLYVYAYWMTIRPLPLSRIRFREKSPSITAMERLTLFLSKHIFPRATQSYVFLPSLTFQLIHLLRLLCMANEETRGKSRSRQATCEGGNTRHVHNRVDWDFHLDRFVKVRTKYASIINLDQVSRRYYFIFLTMWEEIPWG